MLHADLAMMWIMDVMTVNHPVQTDLALKGIIQVKPVGVIEWYICITLHNVSFCATTQVMYGELWEVLCTHVTTG